ncbi:MAG: glycine--tRNA ligase [Planctomycetes bacterium]|nr:glycine--tRNA ligase [Planctomycetota bacterium]
MSKPADTMEKLVSLCKRRGFIFPSSEIYGGLKSCWDYGPLGVELKRNVKEAWWSRMVRRRRDVVGLDASILMHPKVWETSGHVSGFNDPLIDCKKCKARFRADTLDQQVCPEKPSKRPGECGGELTEPRQFNLMFKTNMGPVESSESVVYLRPETAQGIFVNFKNVVDTSRVRPPFGIAQQGKSFRNEIVTENFIFRSREFEQMEMEFFVPPAEAPEWYRYWRDARYKWFTDLGVTPAKLRLREHDKDELAHYSAACADVEYEFPFGWKELEGIANRTDFDLQRHAEATGRDLMFFDDQTKERYFPYVVEPALGVDRAVLTFLVDGYDEEKLEDGDVRTVLHLHPALAPIKCGIFPLVKKEGLPEIAEKLEDELKRHFSVFFDQSGAIGRRYRRQDEIGTPYGVTIDFDTKTDQTVTIRERDSMSQTRIGIDKVLDFLRDKLDF